MNHAQAISRILEKLRTPITDKNKCPRCHGTGDIDNPDGAGEFFDEVLQIYLPSPDFIPCPNCQNHS